MIRACAFVLVVAAASTHAFAAIDLTFANLTVDGDGGSFSVQAAPDDGQGVSVGAYSLNLRFDRFGGDLDDPLEFDTANALPSMIDGGSAFGTTPHPATISAGDVITFVGWGPGFVPGSGADLLDVTFGVPGGFLAGQEFDVTLVPVGDNPAAETIVGNELFNLSAITIRAEVPADACDIDGNGVCDANDIDVLSDHVRLGVGDSIYDLDNSGAVDDDDRLYWVHNLMNTHVGDANLDGAFDAQDFVDVFVAGQYLDGTIANSGWASGDWSGDREFDANDVVAAFIDGGYSSAGAVASVPEPGSLALLASAGLLMLGRARRSSPKSMARRDIVLPCVGR